MVILQYIDADRQTIIENDCIADCTDLVHNCKPYGGISRIGRAVAKCVGGV